MFDNTLLLRILWLPQLPRLPIIIKHSFFFVFVLVSTIAVITITIVIIAIIAIITIHPLIICDLVLWVYVDVHVNINVMAEYYAWTRQLVLSVYFSLEMEENL